MSQSHIVYKREHAPTNRLENTSKGLRHQYMHNCDFLSLFKTHKSHEQAIDILTKRAQIVQLDSALHWQHVVILTQKACRVESILDGICVFDYVFRRNRGEWFHKCPTYQRINQAMLPLMEKRRAKSEYRLHVHIRSYVAWYHTIQIWAAMTS